MSNNVLKAMCDEILHEIEECANMLELGICDERPRINEEWEKKIIETYKIICE